MLDTFWLTFLPIFMAVNAIGLVPMFIGFTEGLNKKQVDRIILQSVITGTAVAMVFLWVGTAILKVLGITVGDFLIAGGALLFAISLDELIHLQPRSEQIDPDSLGAVPLGVPLIVGPAVITTILMLVPQYGAVPTVISTIINIMITGLMFWLSTPIIRLIGNSGAKTLSKIGHLLLAAIAVMMIRRGIFLILADNPALK